MKIMPLEHPENSFTQSAEGSASGTSDSRERGVGSVGGPAAIEALYRSIHERLWRSLLAFTGDADIASDAEAETFTQALARGNELRDPAAWVWRSAFRIASGMMGDRNRSSGQAPNEQISMEAPLIDLLSTLGTLSDQQRKIVVLRYAAGFRPSEIADLLDTSPSAVSVQLHRSHRQLRKKL